MFSLLLFLLLFAHGPPADASSPTAYPCIDGRIMMAIDISTELSGTNFEATIKCREEINRSIKQINFLSHQVFTDEWTDLDRFTLVQYAEFAWERPFGAQEFAVDVRNQLQDVVQHMEPNLTRAFETIDYWQSEGANDVVHLIVFVSKIDQQIVDASRPFVQRLQQKNYELTFVALGAQLESALFSQLSPNLIQWDVDQQNVPTGWSQHFWTAYGCGDEPSGNITATPGGFTCPTETSPLPITYATGSTRTPKSSCQKETIAVMQDTSGTSLQIQDFKHLLYYRLYGNIEGFWWGYYKNDRSSIWDVSGYTPQQFDQWMDDLCEQYVNDATLLK
ncbi:hypothetical protein M3Y99_00909300 [Aphelenchoides fujianensis]|nr:hypothetical protein M3Y99_00909300 [Aphelenchoides fujianensis]